MESEKANYPVQRMARLLRVSRSGFYAWRRRRRSESSARSAERAGLDVKVRRAHTKSYGTYGAPRILADLRTEGEVVSGKTVAKSMRANGLRGCAPRPWRSRSLRCPGLCPGFGLASGYG